MGGQGRLHAAPDPQRKRRRKAPHATLAARAWAAGARVVGSRAWVWVCGAAACSALVVVALQSLASLQLPARAAVVLEYLEATGWLPLSEQACWSSAGVAWTLAPLLVRRGAVTAAELERQGADVAGSAAQLEVLAAFIGPGGLSATAQALCGPNRVPCGRAQELQLEWSGPLPAPPSGTPPPREEGSPHSGARTAPPPLESPSGRLGAGPRLPPTPQHQGLGWVARAPLAGILPRLAAPSLLRSLSVRITVSAPGADGASAGCEAATPLGWWDGATAPPPAPPGAPGPVEPPSKPAIAVAVVGDSQSGAPVFRATLATLAGAAKASRAGGASALLHLGDGVQSPDSDPREWRSYLFGPVHASGVLVGPQGTGSLVWARGNHDEGAGREHAILPPPVQLARVGHVALLVLPAGHGGRVAGVAAQGGEHAPAQAPGPGSASGWQRELEAWAKLAVDSQAWRGAAVRVVVSHVPPCITHWEREAWEAGESADPEAAAGRISSVLALADEAGAPARAVLSGHSHLYQRGMWEWQPGRFVLAATIGTAGGAMEADPPVGECPWMQRTVLGQPAGALLRAEPNSGGFVEAALDVIATGSGLVIDSVAL